MVLDFFQRRGTDEKSSVPAQNGTTLGIIDLGSNSARLLIVRISPDAFCTVLNRVKHMVRLGEGGFTHKTLQEVTMIRTLGVLKSFADMCASYEVHEILAIATAAVRDASNGLEFMNRVFTETGLRFTVISGLEEARLIYLGVSRSLERSNDLRLYIDIGGGSTELAVGDSNDIKNLDSLKLGCVRLTNQFLQNETGHITQTKYEKIRRAIRDEAMHAFRRLREYAIREAVGSSGTAQNLAEIAALGIVPGTSGKNPERLTFEDLTAVVRALCDMTLEQRQALPCINPNRAEVIVAGAAILHTIMEEQKLPSIAITSRTLLDGILEDYLMRCWPEHFYTTMPVRDQSVLRLARRCRFEETHSRHVTNLALSLFDSARAAGLHKADAEARDLLRYAALLHDIGIFIAYSGHHAHSRYLIRNTELLGFTARDIEIIADTACAHRKRPGKKDTILADLNDKDRDLVRLLCVFLILGERLDRSHSGLVRTALFLRDNNKITLHLDTTRPCPIELEALSRSVSMVEKAFDCTLTISSSCPGYV